MKFINQELENLKYGIFDDSKINKINEGLCQLRPINIEERNENLTNSVWVNYKKIKNF